MEKKKEERFNWMEQAAKDYHLDDEIKRNPGFGKPLPKSFFKGDTYTNFLKTAKEAGYLPSWIKLQKEIRDEIGSVLISKKENAPETVMLNSIIKINEKIVKYNRECPPNMQKGRVSLENIEKQHDNWE